MNNQHKQTEDTSFYDYDTIQNIITHLTEVWINDKKTGETMKQKFKNGTKIELKFIRFVKKRMKLDLPEMSDRSPALFWSICWIFHGQNKNVAINKLIRKSITEIRKKNIMKTHPHRRSKSLLVPPPSKYKTPNRKVGSGKRRKFDPKDGGVFISQKDWDRKLKRCRKENSKLKKENKQLMHQRSLSETREREMVYTMMRESEYIH